MRDQRSMRTFESDEIWETDLTHLSCEYLYQTLMTGGPGNQPINYQTLSDVILEKHGEYMSTVRLQKHVQRYLENCLEAEYPPSIRARTWEAIELKRAELRQAADPLSMFEEDANQISSQVEVELEDGTRIAVEAGAAYSL